MNIYCRKMGEVQGRPIAVRKRKFPYYDEAPLAVPGTTEVREYMALGVVADEEIGEMSEIKESDTYLDSIGIDLGIIGPEETGPDYAVLAPTLTAKINGSHVELGWDWQGFGKFLDMAELHVDRGSGFAILAFDTTPGYIDTTPFPATPTVWKYRAIYRVDDMQVGLWSATVSVTVGV